MPTRTEAQFIRAYGRGPSGRKLVNSIRACKLGAVSRTFAGECERLGLVEYAYTAFYHVSPRGLDLLATADAIDFDPATVLDPAPKPVACGACENGRVVISRGGVAVDPDEELEMTARCEACGGSGEARTPWRFAKIIDAEATRTRDALNASLGLDPAGGPMYPVHAEPLPAFQTFRQVSHALAEAEKRSAQAWRARVLDSVPNFYNPPYTARIREHISPAPQITRDNFVTEREKVQTRLAVQHANFGRGPFGGAPWNFSE